MNNLQVIKKKIIKYYKISKISKSLINMKLMNYKTHRSKKIKMKG